MSNVIRLLTNVTTDGSGSYQRVDEGGYYSVEGEGTWNGATMTFSVQGAQKGNAIPLADIGATTISITADGRKVALLATGDQVRGTLASSGASTNLSASLRKIRLVR